MKLTYHKNGDVSMRLDAEAGENCHGSEVRAKALAEYACHQGGPYSWFADAVRVMVLEHTTQAIATSSTGTDANLVVFTAVLNALLHGDAGCLDILETLWVIDPTGGYSRRHLRRLEDPAEAAEANVDSRWQNCIDCEAVHHDDREWDRQFDPPLCEKHLLRRASVDEGK